MKVGLFQLDSLWEDKDNVKHRIIKILDKSEYKIDCLVCPEMTLTGFSMNNTISNLTDKDFEFFYRIAKQKDMIVLYGGCKDNYNCIVLSSPAEKCKLVYQKHHLFSYGKEDKYYNYGEVDSIIEFKDIKFCFAVCYDLRFSYLFWNRAKQCDAYIVIANWPESRREHWKALLRARAIENLAYCIGVNRVGKDPNQSYSGDSIVYGPFGEVVLDCGSSEGIYFCEIDKREVHNIRSEYKFLEDRKNG